MISSVFWRGILLTFDLWHGGNPILALFITILFSNFNTRRITAVKKLYSDSKNCTQWYPYALICIKDPMEISQRNMAEYASIYTFIDTIHDFPIFVGRCWEVHSQPLDAGGTWNKVVTVLQ